MVLELSSGNKLLDPKKVLQKVGLKEKMKVADLGCGAVGYYVFPASEMIGSKGQLYAVDVQKHILENIEKRAQLENRTNVITVWSDLERYGATSIPSKSLDVVLLFNLLFQTKDRLTVLKEAARLLEIGGRMAVVDWLSTGIPFGPPIEGRVSHDWVEEEADKLGLKILKRFSPGPYHYGLIFEK